MATKLDPSELVTFKEPIIVNSIQVNAGVKTLIQELRKYE